jgi:hypothetical protein
MLRGMRVKSFPLSLIAPNLLGVDLGMPSRPLAMATRLLAAGRQPFGTVRNLKPDYAEQSCKLIS